MKRDKVAEEPSRPRLGRGLAALIGDVGDETLDTERGRGARRVPVEFLRPNPRNPRKHFAEAELAELAASIRQRGIVQPIVVRAMPGLPDAYEIVAGERRWRAAQAADLDEVPIVVVEIDDRTSLEYAILENVQRADLNAIEEASGFQRLMEEFGYSAAELGTILGKSRSHVANLLRLLGLPAAIQAMVVEGRISAGHARALLAVKDPQAVAARVVEEGLSVREVERIAQEEQAAPAEGAAAPPRRRAEKDSGTRLREREFGEVIGLAVTLQSRGEGGELRIRYQTPDELDGLFRRLKESPPR